MALAKVLEAVILDLMRGNKPLTKIEKYKIGIIRREDRLYVTSKMGTIVLDMINGSYRIQDNGNVNSWNSNMLDHIQSFQGSIDTKPPRKDIKNRIICFGEALDRQWYKTYSYPNVTIERLNELYEKGYRYFITTLEEHVTLDLLNWIKEHEETRFIHMLNPNVDLPPNSISYDHRWRMFDILCEEYPNNCVLITHPDEWIPDERKVVLCNFSNEDNWKQLKYIDGYYYWSMNPSSYHHNSIRVHTNGTSLIDDALWIFDYYSSYQHKPEATPLGKYDVDSKGYRIFKLYDKYVFHNGQELNTYIVEC